MLKLFAYFFLYTIENNMAHFHTVLFYNPIPIVIPPNELFSQHNFKLEMFG